jgi:hypothetical protein
MVGAEGPGLPIFLRSMRMKGADVLSVSTIVSAQDAPHNFAPLGLSEFCRSFVAGHAAVRALPRGGRQ